MAHLECNTFASYRMTDEEKLQGSILTITQKQVIQNHIASIAEEKLALEFNVDKPQAYIQAEAGLAGQIAALKYLLDLSTASEDIQAAPHTIND